MEKVAMTQRRKRQSDLVCKNVIMSTVLVAFFLLHLPGLSYANAVQWQFRTPFGESDSSPAVGDLDDDGVLDLVLCSTSGRIFALDANGSQKWFFDTGQTISNAPTISDIDTGEPKVFAITNPGKIYCLDGESGVRLWDYTMPAAVDWGSTLLVAANIDKNTGTEIVAADKMGNLVCLSSRGSVIWVEKYKDGFNSAPAIADLNGDGDPEILVGSKGSPLVCFSNKGIKKWQLNEKGSVGSSPLVCDLNNDKKPDILVGQNQGLSLVDNHGNIQWHYPMRKNIHDAISVGDINNDGMEEIIVVDLFGKVACLDYRGKLLWTANVEQRARRSPAIADLDGDFVPEIIIGGYSAALHIFDTDGNLKERLPLNRAMNSSPTVVDFKGDNNLELIVAAETDITSFSWLNTKPEAPLPVLWAEYRASSARSGSVIQSEKPLETRIVELNYGGPYVGSNEFLVRVANPKKQSVTIELEIARNGERPLVAKHTSSDTVVLHQLPYTIIGQAAVNITFQVSVRARKQLITKNSETFYLVPFAKDLADLNKIHTKIKVNLSKLDDPSYARNQLTLMMVKMRDLEKQVMIAGTLSPLDRSTLRDAVVNLREESMQLLRMTDSAVTAGTVLAIYPANPWAPFGGKDEIVEQRISSANVVIEAFDGELESAALNLANFSSKVMIVRVKAEPFLNIQDSSTISAKEVLTIHEVLNVPTQALDLSADALPLLGQAQTIILPAWDVRQVWFTVNTSALDPGDWKSNLHFKTLNVTSTEARIEMSAKVWKTPLPQEQALKLCHWGYVHTSVLKDQPLAAFQDQVNHGTNVFVATNTFAPRARFDKNGDIIGEIDFSDHDPYMRQHTQEGLILFFNYQVSLKGEAERFSVPWMKAYKQWLKAWVDHLQQMGIGYEKFALYPIDEPGLREGLVDDYIAFSKPIREIDGNVQIYTDPVANASLSDLKKMTPYVDIWCPNRNGFLLDEGLDKLAYIKSTGKTVWTYECEGNAKHQSPLGYYRGQSWLAWYHGLTGIGFWSYCTSRHDPWYVPKGGADYLLIYQGDGVVTSKRWEAVRDGIEDYKILFLLKEAIERSKSHKELADEVKLARELLSQDVAEVAGFCGIDESGTLPGAEGLSVVRHVEDKRWQKYKDVRRAIAKLLNKMGLTGQQD